MGLDLFARLTNLGQALSGISDDPVATRKEADQKNLLTPEISAIIRQKILSAVIPTIKAMLATNYAASGIGVKTGTLYRGTVTDVNIFVNQKNSYIIIQMPSGLRYEGKGNPYASAGAKKYGSLHQARPMRAILDTVVGGQDRGLGYQYVNNKPHAIFGYRNQGVLGAKAKRSIKQAILKGAKLSNRQGKASDAIKSGGITVTPPRPPFFTLTPAQLVQLRTIQLQVIATELSARGLKVNPNQVEMGLKQQK